MLSGTDMYWYIHIYPVKNSTKGTQAAQKVEKKTPDSPILNKELNTLIRNKVVRYRRYDERKITKHKKY